MGSLLFTIFSWCIWVWLDLSCLVFKITVFPSDPVDSAIEVLWWFFFIFVIIVSVQSFCLIPMYNLFEINSHYETTLTSLKPVILLLHPLVLGLQLQATISSSIFLVSLPSVKFFNSESLFSFPRLCVILFFSSLTIYESWLNPSSPKSSICSFTCPIFF